MAQPMQCIPIAWKAGIAWGQFSTISEIRVSLVISIPFTFQKKVHKRLGRFCAPTFCTGGLGLLSHLSEALAAVDGTIGLGLKRNLCLAAAGSAGSGKELAGTTGGVLARVAADFAALGLILETALCIKLLLSCGKNELVTTLFAN